MLLSNMDFNYFFEPGWVTFWGTFLGVFLGAVLGALLTIGFAWFSEEQRHNKYILTRADEAIIKLYSFEQITIDNGKKELKYLSNEYPKKLNKKLYNLMGDDNLRIRLFAATLLTKTGDKRGKSLLFTYLSGRDTKIKKDAIEAIGETKDEVFVSKLSNVLRHDENPSIRISAAFSLAKIDGSNSVSTIREAIEKEKFHWAKEKYLWALKSIGGSDAIEVMVSTLADDKVKETATEELGKLGECNSEGIERAIIPLANELETAIDSQNTRLAEKIIQALWKIEKYGAVSHLRKIQSGIGKHNKEDSQDMDHVKTRLIEAIDYLEKLKY